jgi:hypothetical protein
MNYGAKINQYGVSRGVLLTIVGRVLFFRIFAGLNDSG